VASVFDFSDHKAAAYAPQMTLDMLVNPGRSTTGRFDLKSGE